MGFRSAEPGSGYIVADGNSRSYMISGGTSGGTFEPESPVAFTVPPPPGDPTDKPSWAIWFFTLIGFGDPGFLSCLATLLTAIATITLKFSGLGAIAMIVMIGLLWIGAPIWLSILAAVVVFAALMSWFAYIFYQDSKNCWLEILLGDEAP